MESVLLHELNIRSCTGCFRCWNVTPGICTGIKDDDAEEITKKVINSAREARFSTFDIGSLI